MSIKVNGGSDPTSIKYNGNNVTEVRYNGTKVWPEQRQWRVITGVTPSGAGTVTGAGFYNDGDYATITATPNSGYNFIKYTGTQETTLNPRSIQVFSDWTMIANFGSPTISYNMTRAPHSYTGWRVVDGYRYTFNEGSEIKIEYGPDMAQNPDSGTLPFRQNKDMVITYSHSIKDLGYYLENPYPVSLEPKIKKVIIKVNGSTVKTYSYSNAPISYREDFYRWPNVKYTVSNVSGNVTVNANWDDNDTVYINITK